MSAFGKLLRQLIDATGKSARAWALEHGSSVSHVGNVMNGRRTPSLMDLSKWADALGLTGDMRRRFIRLGCIAHLPAEIQPEFETIIRDVEILRQRVDRMERDRRVAE